MASGWMKQKKAKQARMRRAWATPLSRKSGIQPNRIVINQYKQTAKGIGIDEEFEDKLARELQRELFGQELARQMPPGKIEALKKQAELESKLDGCDLAYKEGPGPSNLYQRSVIYCNSRHTMFVVVHYDYREGVMRRSREYSCEEILVVKWKTNSILWAEKKPIQLPG